MKLSNHPKKKASPKRKFVPQLAALNLALRPLCRPKNKIFLIKSKSKQ